MAEDFSFYDFNMAPEDQFDYQSASYEQLPSGWSMGQNLGTLDSQPTFDWGNWEDVLEAPQLPAQQQTQPWLPEQAPTGLTQEPQGPGGFDPRLAEAASPSVGQPTGPQGAGREDDWLQRLAKAGLGMGVGVGGSLLSQALTPQPKQARQAATPVAAALPAALTAPSYTPEPLAALPGTKASPLISGRPTSVRLSAGLEERRPGRGGFSMY